MPHESDDQGTVPHDLRKRRRTQNEAKARFREAIADLFGPLTGTTTKECNCRACNHMERGETRCYNRPKALFNMLVAGVRLHAIPRFAGRLVSAFPAKTL
jgi:hypothetical protein